MSGIECEKMMPIMLKAAVYNNVIRPVLMYGSETWALRKAEQNLLERTEMRMLRWMMGIKRIEKIRYGEIRARTGVANISEKIRKGRLRWLGHAERKTEEDVVKRRWKYYSEFRRPTCRRNLDLFLKRLLRLLNILHKRSIMKSKQNINKV